MSRPAPASHLFRGTALPWLLLLPQLVITGLFFFWPAGQAVWQSLLREDAFGLRSEFVGLENFADVLADPTWLASFGRTLLFSGSVAGLALVAALFLAVQADRNIRGASAFDVALWDIAGKAAGAPAAGATSAPRPARRARQSKARVPAIGCPPARARRHRPSSR